MLEAVGVGEYVGVGVGVPGQGSKNGNVPPPIQVTPGDATLNPYPPRLPFLIQYWNNGVGSIPETGRSTNVKTVSSQQVKPEIRLVAPVI